MAISMALAWAGCGAEKPPSPADAGDPGGNTRVPFATAAGAKAFGFSDSAFSADDPYNPGGLGTAETVSAARAAGANSTRIGFQWRLAEPSEGDWNENYISQLRAVARGFPRPPVVFLLFAPPWANPQTAGSCPPGVDCRYPPAADRLDAWQTFVRRALKEFPNADIEVWNEPNLQSYWQPGIDPEAYAALVKSTWDVVNAERTAGRTKARVLAGAVAQVPDNGNKTRLPWNFLQDAYDKGLKGHYDAISWHSYAYQFNDDVEQLGAKSNFARDWKFMRKVVRENDPGKHFWITETGVTRGGKGSTTSAANQAKVLLELVRRQLTMRDVDGVFVHTLFEWAIFSPGTREREFGLIEAPSSGERKARPAYCALVRAAHGRTDLCR